MKIKAEGKEGLIFESSFELFDTFDKAQKQVVEFVETEFKLKMKGFGDNCKVTAVLSEPQYQTLLAGKTVALKTQIHNNSRDIKFLLFLSPIK